VRPPRDFQSLIDYLNLMSANNVDLKGQLGPNASDIMALAKEYQLSFKIILGTARETNNTILLLGPIAEVNDRLVRHFGNLA
jgi:hypothetical protein